MLKIDIMPIKGVLCVRLYGKLTKDSIDKLNNEVIKFQKQVGIKNIIFNIGNLTHIDNYGKRAIINSFKLCLNNNGEGFICLEDNQKLSPIFTKYISKDKIVKDELTAINLINL